MSNYLMIFLLFLVAFWFIWSWFNKKPTKGLGIPGKLIWVDRGKNTKPFFNSSFRVLGKPDLMYQVNDGILAVEYKGRKNTIYDSDVIQGMTASLAARGEGYKVIRLLIKTDNQERYVELPTSDKSLYDLVSTHIEIVRQAKQGIKLPAKPSYYKCLHCAYGNSCTKKVN